MRLAIKLHLKESQNVHWHGVEYRIYSRAASGLLFWC